LQLDKRTESRAAATTKSRIDDLDPKLPSQTSAPAYYQLSAFCPTLDSQFKK
jgi:hypothetical protein